MRPLLPSLIILLSVFFARPNHLHGETLERSLSACGSLISRALVALRVRGARYTWYTDPVPASGLPNWSRETFWAAVSRDGIYSRAVLALASRQGISPAAALRSLHYLQKAPKPVAIGMMLLNTCAVGAWIPPFVSTSRDAGIAATYSVPRNKALAGNSILIVSDAGTSWTQYRIGSESAAREALELMLTSTRFADAEVANLNLNPDAPNRRLLETYHWLKEHRWLEDLMDPASLNIWSPKERLEMFLDVALALERTTYGVLKSQREELQLLHLPASAILGARLYDGQRREIERYVRSRP